MPYQKLLLFTAGRLNTSTCWVKVHISEPMQNLHYGHFFIRPLGSDSQKEADISAEHMILCTWLLKFPSLSSSFIEHSLGHKYIHDFFNPMRGVGISTCLFPKVNCHQFSNHVPLKSLAINPKHWPHSMNKHIIPCWSFILPSNFKNQVHFINFSSLTWFPFITVP